jgi:hypothetical protein
MEFQNTYLSAGYNLHQRQGVSRPTWAVEKAITLYNLTFAEASWKALLARLVGRDTALPTLAERWGNRPGSESFYAGIEPVAAARITGSENRARDFDTAFRPLHTRTKDRWVGIAIAFLMDEILPPVSLIRIAGQYYVRDGHHRISVACALGQDHVDAEIIAFDLQDSAEPVAFPSSFHSKTVSHRHA